MLTFEFLAFAKKKIKNRLDLMRQAVYDTSTHFDPFITVLHDHTLKRGVHMFMLLNLTFRPCDKVTQPPALTLNAPS